MQRNISRYAFDPEQKGSNVPNAASKVERQLLWWVALAQTLENLGRCVFALDLKHRI